MPEQENNGPSLFPTTPGTPPGSAYGIAKDAIAHLDPEVREWLATPDGLREAINLAWAGPAQELYKQRNRAKETKPADE